MASKRASKDAKRIPKAPSGGSPSKVPGPSVPVPAPDIPHPLGELPPDIVEDGRVVGTSKTAGALDDRDDRRARESGGKE
jgi:hypothetical protein